MGFETYSKGRVREGLKLMNSDCDRNGLPVGNSPTLWMVSGREPCTLAEYIAELASRST